MTTNANLNNEIMAEIASEAMASLNEASAPRGGVGDAKENFALTQSGKKYSTRKHKGYSKVQMNAIYRHCKKHDLYIAKSVMEKMYNWAGKYEDEKTPELEDLRQAACKAISCVFLGNYKVAQKKVRFIESVLKKNEPKAA